MEILKQHQVEWVDKEDIRYSKTSLSKDFTIVMLPSGGFIAYTMSSEIWMNFYIFQFVGSSEEDGDVGELVWYGEGPLGNLKELRHSYFPEYIFYISLNLMSEAVQWLQSNYEEN